jgi:ferredoxin
MSKRKIIKIDEIKCNGCGLCIPNCPEGALQVIDGKARLVSDLFCDGLGACIGYCPQAAITIEEREAEKYDEIKVMENIVRQGKNTIKAHLEHLKSHGERAYLQQALDYLKSKGIEAPQEASGTVCACPGSRPLDLRKEVKTDSQAKVTGQLSHLSQWPVQIMLVPPTAAYFNHADLLIAADCVPFAYADFHEDLLKGKILLVGCPKLDDLNIYENKITEIIRYNDIKSITYAHMEVPCCFGLVRVIQAAIAASGKTVPLEEVVVGIRGARLK